MLNVKCCSDLYLLELIFFRPPSTMNHELLSNLVFISKDRTKRRKRQFTFELAWRVFFEKGNFVTRKGKGGQKGGQVYA